MSDNQTCATKQTYSFPASLRLLTAQDYKRVFNNNPVKLVCPPFTLLAVPSTSENARLGLIIAKKTVRKAVDRNRLKRIARESFRLNSMHIPHYDLVLLARRGSSEMPNKVLFEHLERLWVRLQKKVKQ